MGKPSPATVKSATLIVGLGNSLMRDDGVGVFVIEQLRKMPFPAHITLANCGSDVLKILSHFHQHQRVVFVDAVEMGAPPGTIRYFPREAILKMPGESQAAHQLSAIEAIRLLDTLNPHFRQAELHLIGVQPEVVAVGEGLSPSVHRAARQIIKEIRKRYY